MDPQQQKGTFQEKENKSFPAGKTYFQKPFSTTAFGIRVTTGSPVPLPEGCSITSAQHRETVTIC